MYANLHVKVADHEAIYACEVRIERGELIVVEDLNGGGSYAEPGPVHSHPLASLPPVTITADF